MLQEICSGSNASYYEVSDFIKKAVDEKEFHFICGKITPASTHRIGGPVGFTIKGTNDVNDLLTREFIAEGWTVTDTERGAELTQQCIAKKFVESRCDAERAALVDEMLISFLCK